MLENMLRSLGPYWVIAPILASLATQCGQSPRGALPTTIVSVTVRLDSVPAPLPDDQQELAACLERMGGGNHVAASWQNEAVTLLTEIAPNVFTASFNDVPTEFLVTITVHDRNECRRNPTQLGHVPMGVFANGERLTTVLEGNNNPVATVDAGNNVLAFVVANDGVVTSPVLD